MRAVAPGVAAHRRSCADCYFLSKRAHLRPAGPARKTRPTATTSTPTRSRSARKAVICSASRPARSNSLWWKRCDGTHASIADIAKSENINARAHEMRPSAMTGAFTTRSMLSPQGGLSFSLWRGGVGEGASSARHCARSFRRCWRVACSQKFRCFYGQRGLQSAFTAIATQLFFQKSAAMDNLHAASVLKFSKITHSIS